ncbi:MAG: hypothetical protein RLY93_02465 [Sumerlaeia bacterium]
MNGSNFDDKRFDEAMRGALRDSEPEAPESLHGGIMARLESAETPQRRRLTPVIMIAAGLAAAVLALGILLRPAPTPVSQPTPSPEIATDPPPPGLPDFDLPALTVKTPEVLAGARDDIRGTALQFSENTASALRLFADAAKRSSATPATPIPAEFTGEQIEDEPASS